ncbi:Nat1p [Sugiyamaella lignohabitans]|uniref:Nat1p n=1 Tax=Sugiyamaella lignohabitans TaxID=796027 RepID=A0A167D3Y2_9ASCO|nr:Nat1p [Sugiyamaella lignohabitans]ANB12444.1 Nat1p [Sugiyamaella lignohabitans]
MATAIPKNRILAPKDASNFRAALKLYEAKQYKKALKGVEGVLKKSPNHGESLALKGLVLYHLGKKEEGHESIKKGLEKDSTSYVCWHIYGLYHRQEKDYEEATKSYSKALQYDPENQNVIRDLGILQMQVRQYDALVSTRSKMLSHQPGFRQNWNALAIAQHLSGDYAGAEKTLLNFEQVTANETLAKDDAENSEILLYKNLIIYESGDVARALEDLESISDKVLDVKCLNEWRAKYLLELGRAKDAEKQYRMLIKRNPECREYYLGLEKALNIKEDDIPVRTALYHRLAEKYPKADLPRSIPLGFLAGNSAEFKKNVAEYISNYLVRQVPSTFVIVKPLYKDLEKRAIIDEFIHELIQNQRAASVDGNASSNGVTAVNGESSVTNGDAADSANGAKTQENDDSSSSPLLWGLYYLAQHYSYLSKHELALKTIDEAINMSPKLLELLMTKAHILKRAGDIEGAANVMDEARKLDLSDRFINTKTAKYLLRANKIDEAITTISMFTKNDANGKGVQDMHDMQGLWFLGEQAEAYARIGNDGMALKRFHAVFFIYEDAKNDQFDFHFYCPRRGTIRAYLNMINWSKNVDGNVPYQRAAAGAIKIYLKLAVKQARREAGEAPEDDDEYLGMDEAEKKKAIKKAKKERAKELKKEHEEREKAVNADPDMFGKQLLATSTPLQEAFKIWKPLSEAAPDNYKTWQLGFDVYLAQKKYVLALQALSKAKACGARHSWVVGSALRAKHDLEADEAVPAALKLVSSRTLPTIVTDGNIVEDDLKLFADKYIIDSEKPISIVDWANTKIAIQGLNEVQTDVETRLLTVPSPTTSLEDATEAYNLLRSWRSPRLAEYRSKASQLWPRATVFSESA